MDNNKSNDDNNLVKANFFRDRLKTHFARHTTSKQKFDTYCSRNIHKSSKEYQRKHRIKKFTLNKV